MEIQTFLKNIKLLEHLEVATADFKDSFDFTPYSQEDFYKGNFKTKIVVLEFLGDKYSRNIIEASPSTSFILFVDPSQMANGPTELSHFFSEMSHIKAIIDINADPFLSRFHFKNLLNLVPKKNEKNYSEMSEYLQGIIANSLERLEDVKRIHRKLVPIKVNKFKGVTFSSKFVSGISNGGEFFDVFEYGNKLLVHIVSSNSYVISSKMITRYEQLKTKTSLDFDSLETYLNESIQIFLGDDDSHKVELEILTGILDLSTMEFNGLGKGRFAGFSDSGECLFSGESLNSIKDFQQSFSISFKMKRAKRFLILSPGIFKNSSGYIDQKNINTFVKNVVSKSASDIFDEVFFQLSRTDGPVYFLENDSYLLHIEVDKNAIIQV